MALVVLLSFVSSLASPVLLAQDLDIYGGGSNRGTATYQPTDEEYAGDVASHVALKEDLEKRWADAAVRSDQYRKQLERLRAATPPAGANPSEWYAARDKKVAQLEQYIIANDRNVADFRRNLGSVYGQIDSDKRRLYSVQDEGLKQNLGTLLGVGGTLAAPIAARPTIGNLTGAVGRSINGARLNSVTKNIASSQTRSAALGDKIANMQPPSPRSWTMVEEGGRVLMRSTNGQVKDMGPSTIKSANGTDIRNDSAFRSADYHGELYGAKANIQNQIDTLRFNRNKASSIKAKDAIDKRIGELEGKKVQLEKDISQYDSTHQSAGSQLKGLAASAAKWAAFSAGITVTTNLITQLTHNGWNFNQLDWRAAVAPLMTGEFWGGTAGSFGVSMLLSSVIPGGAFVKTLAAIGGAAVGWQLGTGNLFETDWTELISTSVGSTVGVLIGTAIGGPVGGFIGGIVGNFAATWILGKVREWLEASSEAADPREFSKYPGASDPPGYNAPTTFDKLPVEDLRSSDPGQLKAMMDEAYMQMMQYARDPSQASRFEQSRQKYMMLKQQLEQLQRGTSSGMK